MNALRKQVMILGSTGSVGESTLDVIRRNPGEFEVHTLTAQHNLDRLAAQCAEYGAKYAVIAEDRLARRLRAALERTGSHARVLCGESGLIEAAAHPEVDVVMAAIVGAAGLRPTFAAAQAGKKILLANKESLVIAGPLFVEAAAAAGALVLPVDSEHNAVFQALPPGYSAGLEQVGVERIILTASGGPFLDLPAEQLRHVTPDQACKHPNWVMGRKISVDSATLMNKGLELIEARWLFHARPEQLEVVIHPQSIIHSLVAFRDGSLLAQMGNPDMRTPIAHALAWPQRIEAGVRRLNLAEMGTLSFRQPDPERFPCLRLAHGALRDGASVPVVLNAANEIAVERFLQGRLRFDRIAALVEEVMQRFGEFTPASLEEVLAFDSEVRCAASAISESMK